jgi:hypothetical protein
MQKQLDNILKDLRIEYKNLKILSVSPSGTFINIKLDNIFQTLILQNKQWILK